MHYLTDIEKEIKVANKLVVEFHRLNSLLHILDKLSNKFDGLNYNKLIVDDVKKNPNHYKAVKDLTKNLVALKTNNDLFLKSISNIERLLNRTGVIIVKDRVKYSVDVKKHKSKLKPFNLDNQTILGYYEDLTIWLRTLSKEIPN